MSPVTKIFIVLLVILSLVLSAGMVVFVNRTENFKNSVTALQAQKDRATALLDTEMVHNAALAKDADAARLARDTEAAAYQKQLLDKDGEIAKSDGQNSELQGDLKIANVTIDGLKSTVNASEEQRKALGDLLETTRTDNNTLHQKVNQDDLAINDLTARLQGATRLVSDYQETIAQQKKDLEAAQKQIADAGGRIKPADEVGLEAGAPPINAVVRRTQMIGGIPYATISVGSSDQVVKGMKFYAIDGGNFLGEITIETVDEKEATGKMEGPKISEIKVNTEAKTHL